MIEIATQTKDQCPACQHSFVYLMPFSEEDIDELKTYPFHKILKNKITGELKERSLIQLRLYWGACRFLAKQLSDHQHQFDAADIDFEIKRRVAKKAPALVKVFNLLDGGNAVGFISIAMKNMKHLEACRYFDKAYPLMGDMIGKTADEFVVLVKASFKR